MAADAADKTVASLASGLGVLQGALGQMQGAMDDPKNGPVMNITALEPAAALLEASDADLDLLIAAYGLEEADAHKLYDLRDSVKFRGGIDGLVKAWNAYVEDANNKSDEEIRRQAEAARRRAEEEETRRRQAEAAAAAEEARQAKLREERAALKSARDDLATALGGAYDDPTGLAEFLRERVAGGWEKAVAGTLLDPTILMADATPSDPAVVLAKTYRMLAGVLGDTAATPPAGLNLSDGLPKDISDQAKKIATIYDTYNMFLGNPPNIHNQSRQEVENAMAQAMIAKLETVRERAGGNQATLQKINRIIDALEPFDATALANAGFPIKALDETAVQPFNQLIDSLIPVRVMLKFNTHTGVGPEISQKDVDTNLHSIWSGAEVPTARFRDTNYGPFYNIFTDNSQLAIEDDIKLMFQRYDTWQNGGFSSDFSPTHLVYSAYGYSGSGKTYTLLEPKNKDSVFQKVIHELTEYQKQGYTVSFLMYDYYGEVDDKGCLGRPKVPPAVYESQPLGLGTSSVFEDITYFRYKGLDKWESERITHPFNVKSTPLDAPFDYIVKPQVGGVKQVVGSRTTAANHPRALATVSPIDPLYQDAATKQSIKEQLVKDYLYKPESLEEIMAVYESLNRYRESTNFDPCIATKGSGGCQPKQRYHIRATPNNPSSSRSHLFIDAYIQQDDRMVGKITVMDMAGSEDVNQIQNNYFRAIQLTTFDVDNKDKSNKLDPLDSTVYIITDYKPWIDLYNKYVIDDEQRKKFINFLVWNNFVTIDLVRQNLLRAAVLAGSKTDFMKESLKQFLELVKINNTGLFSISLIDQTNKEIDASSDLSATVFFKAQAMVLRMPEEALVPANLWQSFQKAYDTMKEVYNNRLGKSNRDNIYRIISNAEGIDFRRRGELQKIKTGMIGIINQLYESNKLDDVSPNELYRAFLKQRAEQHAKIIRQYHCPLRFQGEFINRTLAFLQQYTKHLVDRTKTAPTDHLTANLLPANLLGTNAWEERFNLFVCIRLDFHMDGKNDERHQQYLATVPTALGFAHQINPFSATGPGWYNPSGSKKFTIGGGGGGGMPGLRGEVRYLLAAPVAMALAMALGDRARVGEGPRARTRRLAVVLVAYALAMAVAQAALGFPAGILGTHLTWLAIGLMGIGATGELLGDRLTRRAEDGATVALWLLCLIGGFFA